MSHKTMSHKTMNLYAKYLLEREGIHTLETSYGFVTYQCLEDQTVYIMDLYVLPEYRQHTPAQELADAVVELTQAKIVLGSISPDSKNAHQSLVRLLAYGMTLWKIENNLIFFKKEVK